MTINFVILFPFNDMSLKARTQILSSLSKLNSPQVTKKVPNMSKRRAIKVEREKMKGRKEEEFVLYKAFCVLNPKCAFEGLFKQGKNVNLGINIKILLFY